jgi:hypothetical protein
MRRIFIVLIVLFLLMLLVSSVYADTNQQINDESSPYEEIFAWLGKLAVISGALSLSWYTMKSRRVSNVASVRKTANLLYQIHKLTGWSALVLVLIHGTYFIIAKKLELDTITGALAFIMLVAVATTGMFIKRRVHFVLSLVWACLTVIGLSCGFIWWFERRATKT